jgi:hypothetical protein
VREGHEPDFLADLTDADFLTCEEVAGFGSEKYGSIKLASNRK